MSPVAELTPARDDALCAFKALRSRHVPGASSGPVQARLAATGRETEAHLARLGVARSRGRPGLADVLATSARAILGRAACHHRIRLGHRERRTGAGVMGRTASWLRWRPLRPRAFRSGDRERRGVPEDRDGVRAACRRGQWRKGVRSPRPRTTTPGSRSVARPGRCEPIDDGRQRHRPWKCRECGHEPPATPVWPYREAWR